MIKLDYTNEDFNYIDKNIKVGDICAFGYNEIRYQGIWIGKYCKGEITKFSTITLENEIFIFFTNQDKMCSNFLLQPNYTSYYNTCDAHTMIRKVNKKELYLYNLVRKLNKKGISFVNIPAYLSKRFTIQYKKQIK